MEWTISAKTVTKRKRFSRIKLLLGKSYSFPEKMLSEMATVQNNHFWVATEVWM